MGAMREYRSRLFLAALALVLSGCAGTAAASVVRWVNRDGAVQARADLRAGKPPTLLWHYFNGRIPGTRLPGVRNCGWANRDGNNLRFVHFDEADWSEGLIIPEVSAAWRFAERYNRAMFKARKARILRVCPDARLDD